MIASIAMLPVLQGVAAPAWAETATRGTCAAVTTKLTKASSGLLMPSESDEPFRPFTPFTWTDATRPNLTTADCSSSPDTHPTPLSSSPSRVPR